MLDARIWRAAIAALRGASDAARTARSASRPRPVGLLLGLLCAQAAWSWLMPRDWHAESSPGAPPSESALRVAALGEAAAAGYALTLYVQSFDMQAGQTLAIRSLALADIGAWLDRSLDLNPDSGYPLLLASRIYAEAARPDDARAMLRWVQRRFVQAPLTRWPWMAHGLYVARHVIHDDALALEMARTLREYGNHPSVPSWARQAEIFLLTDLDQLQAARVLLGGLLDSGRLTDQAEQAFLARQLVELDRRLGSAGGAPAADANR
jgi:hypothetical protein